jgi:cytidylate kinase
METRVVTISHATGAGGDTIGQTVAAGLGFRYLDEEIITLAARKEGVDAALVADAERRKTFLERLFAGMTEAVHVAGVGGGTLVPDAVAPDATLRSLIVAAIRETADRGDAVIVSHGAAIPLAGRPDVLRVLVTASAATRVRRAARTGHGDAAAFIEDDDRARADYFQRFYDLAAELPTHYDLVVNTDALSADEAADIIVAAARRRGR